MAHHHESEHRPMVTPKAERAYHAVVRRLERLTDDERVDVWQRLSTTYAPNRTDELGVSLSAHVIVDELVVLVAEGLHKQRRRQGDPT